MGRLAERRARKMELRQRQAQGYAEQLLYAHQYSITQASAPLTTAAAELAAGMLGRALAAAEIEPMGSRADAATKSWRERVGRDLITAGEHLSIIEMFNDQVFLWPATSWTFRHGHPDPATWIVDAQVPAPKGTVPVQRPWSGVVSLLWAPDPGRPWRGISPIQAAATTSRLLGATEQSLALEAAGPTGHLIPIPRTSNESLSDLKRALSGINGTSMLVESMPRNGTTRGSHDYQSSRIGASPPAPLVALRQHSERSVLAACGMDVTLITGGAGNSRRESYRQWLHTVVSPIGERLETELSKKLEVPDLTIHFAPLSASDMAGKARAAASLVQSGWTAQEAADVVGIDPPAATNQTPELEMPTG